MALKEKLIDKAQKLIQKGYLDKAIVEYKAAADADPKDISIRLRIGDLYIKVGKKNEAVKEYTEAAKANAQRGFYLKAIAVYRQVLKFDDTIETRNKLAELYLKQRLVADAIGEYSHMVSWFELRGKTGEVLELLKKMVDIDPENVGIRLKLAELYHKLSFEKDSLSEYSVVFEKLLAAGKLETAEKIYLSLHNAHPADERVLSGLSELYRLKGDNAARLKFLKVLFNHYSGSSMDEQAAEVARDIVGISPNDQQASRFLKKEDLPLPFAGRTGAAQEPFSVASSSVSMEPEALPVVEAAPPAPFEEEIEITIEGFEESPVETEASSGESPEERAQETSGVEVEAADDAAPASGSMDSDGAPEVTQSASSGAAPCAADEIDIDIEELLDGILPSIETPQVQAAPQAAPAPDVVSEAPLQALVEEPATRQDASFAGPEAGVAEDAGIEEALSILSTELMEAGSREPAEAEPVLEPEPFHEEVQAAPLEPAEQAHEGQSAESVEAVRLTVEPVVEQPQAQAAVAEAGPEELIGVDISPDEHFEEQQAQAQAQVEPIAPVQTAYAVDESPEAAEPVEPEEYEVLEEDLSSAIQELMEKMEPAEPEAEQAPVAAAPGAPTEEYVDLSAELGMEEALEDLAGPWGGKEPIETFDEFKTGIGNQLSKEDSETHYNLGIAYMEMELYGEASKEFKIAMKDARLEFDCFTRLGLCAMAENNPEEAALYYSKGLKAAVRSDEEKKGLMYELALAYEASGRVDDAYGIYHEIFEMDPDFREAALKVSTSIASMPSVPLNDGMIEVELL